MIGIKMNNNDRYFCEPSTNREELEERVGVIRQQESTTYARRDFMFVQGSEEVETADDEKSRNKVSLECREKICEWSYRVVDHFKIDREVVLTSWYSIDRFLSTQEECNTTLFKLLAMTSLSLASKLFGARRMTMQYLVELSRAEFSVAQMMQMEVFLLRTLKWRVHPPTVKTVIRELLGLLAPTVNDVVLKKVSEYAHFFAELSVYDAKLAGVDATDIALASLVNALNWIFESELTEAVRQSFLEDASRILETDHACEDIQFVQKRLWDVYSRTEECALSTSATCTFEEPVVKRQRREEADRSPITVISTTPYFAAH